MVPDVLPQYIVPHKIFFHIFGPSHPNPNPNRNTYPNPNEVVCCGSGRHWG